MYIKVDPKDTNRRETRKTWNHIGLSAFGIKVPETRAGESTIICTECCTIYHSKCVKLTSQDIDGHTGWKCSECVQSSTTLKNILQKIPNIAQTTKKMAESLRVLQF